MFLFVYNMLFAVINTAAEVLAYTYVLKPRFGRRRTVWMSMGVITASQIILCALLPSGAFLWDTVNPASLIAASVFYRDRWVRKINAFCLLVLAEAVASLLLFPMLQAAQIPLSALPAYILAPESLPFHIAYILVLLAVVTAGILLYRRWPTPSIRYSALNGFVCLQTLAQAIVLFILLGLADVLLDSATLITLWLINCGGLCMMASSLVVALRRERDADLLRQTELSAQMQQQAMARAATCEQDAAEIRADVLRQLDNLMEQIAAGQEGYPAPACPRAPLPYSPSLAVNTLLEHKYAQAAGLGIRLRCRGQLNVPALSEFAMCTVVANMLDNAMSCADAQNPWVTLECIRRGGIRSLVCRNSIPAPPANSTPAGRQGLGLSIIRTATLEAGGRMYLQSTADTFSVILSFSEESGDGGRP